MSTPYIGEIRMVAYNFAPRGWALCNGQLLPISQNTALFSILGTTYGGNGIQNFALPNLQCTFPIHAGNGPGLSYRVLGEMGGEPSHTLSVGEIPQHTHTLMASSDTSSANLTINPSNSFPVNSGNPGYAPVPNSTMAPQALGVAGGGAPHPNLPPYLVVNYIIALIGIYPPPN